MYECESAMREPMKKMLSVTWTRLPGEERPCVRCSDTGVSFSELLSSIRPLLERDGIKVTCEENTQPPSGTSRDGTFMLNGKNLEDLVREADRAGFLCHSSKCQPFTSSVEITRNERGERCVKAPEILFRKAILASLED